MRYIIDGIKKGLILRKPPLRDAACGSSSGQGGCLEERTGPIQPLVNFFTASKVGNHICHGTGPPFPARGRLRRCDGIFERIF
jgi:hypothetical protein